MAKKENLDNFDLEKELGIELEEGEEISYLMLQEFGCNKGDEENE